MISQLKSHSLKIGRHVFLGIFAVMAVYPIILMFFNSFKNNDEMFFSNVYGFPTVFHIENYINAVYQFDFLLFFRNSVLVSLLTIVFTLFISLLFSYAIARMRWRLSNITRIYALIGMFIPVQIVIIPLVIIVRDLHIQHSLSSLVVPYVAFNLSFTSLVFYAFFRTIPFEMEESAAIDGASIYRTFFGIILPLVKPAIATTSIFIFLGSWNELFIAMVVISDNNLQTLPLGLLYFQGKHSTDWGALTAAMSIASFVPIVFYLLFSEQVENALTVGAAVKG